MTNAASDLAKASLAGMSVEKGQTSAADKSVGPHRADPSPLPGAPPSGRQQASRAVLIGVPASAPRQNPPEVVPAPPTPPIAIPLRVAISPVAADGEASGANLAMRCAQRAARAARPAVAQGCFRLSVARAE